MTIFKKERTLSLNAPSQIPANLKRFARSQNGTEALRAQNSRETGAGRRTANSDRGADQGVGPGGHTPTAGVPSSDTWGSSLFRALRNSCETTWGTSRFRALQRWGVQQRGGGRGGNGAAAPHRIHGRDAMGARGRDLSHERGVARVQCQAWRPHHVLACAWGLFFHRLWGPGRSVGALRSPGCKIRVGGRGVRAREKPPWGGCRVAKLASIKVSVFTDMNRSWPSWFRSSPVGSAGRRHLILTIPQPLPRPIALRWS